MLSKKNKTHAHHNKKNIVKKKDLAKAQGFISLMEAAGLCSYSQEYISLLVRKKLLQGEKIGRNWFTKKEWLEKYILEHPAEKKGNTKGELRVEKVFKERIVEIPINKNLKSLRQDFSVWLKNFFIVQKNIVKNNLLYNVSNIKYIKNYIYSKNNNKKNVDKNIFVGSDEISVFARMTTGRLFQRVIISTVIFSLLLTTASAQFFATDISKLGETMESVAEKNNEQILNGLNLVKEKIEVDRVLERFATASENFSATAEYKIKKIAGDDKKENALGSLNQDDSRQSLEPRIFDNFKSTTGQVAGVEDIKNNNTDVNDLMGNEGILASARMTDESLLSQAKNITEKISEAVGGFMVNILVSTKNVAEMGEILNQVQDDKVFVKKISFNFLGLPKNSDQIFGGIVLGVNDFKQNSEQKFLNLLANLQVVTSKKFLAKNSSTESAVEKFARVFFKTSKKTSDFVYDNIFTPIAKLGNMLGGSIITVAKNVGVKIGIYQTDWLKRELATQDLIMALIKRDSVSSVNNFYGSTFYNSNNSGQQVIVLKGEKGETGAKGEKGDTGARGENGLPGKDGSGIAGNTSVTNIYQVGTPGTTASQGAGTVLDVKYLGASELSVSGNTKLNTLTVTGAADFNNAVNIAGNLTLSGATASGGNFTTSGNIIGGGYLKIGTGTNDWALASGSGYFTSNIETDGSLRIDSATTTDPYLWLTNDPVASAENPALLFGIKLIGGSSMGTLIGSNVSNFSGDFLNFQVNDVSKFKIDSDGNITTANSATFGGPTTIISTTTPQLLVGQDAGNQWRSLVDADGNTTFQLVTESGFPEFNFVNPVNLSLATETPLGVDIFNITASTTQNILDIKSSSTDYLVKFDQMGSGGILELKANESQKIAFERDGRILQTASSTYPLYNLVGSTTDYSLAVNQVGAGGLFNWQRNGVNIFALSNEGVLHLQNASSSNSIFSISASSTEPLISLNQTGAGGGIVFLNDVQNDSTSALLQYTDNPLNFGAANGTFIAANPNIFSGNWLDFQVAGTRYFSLASDGDIFSAGGMLITNNSSTALSVQDSSGTTHFVIDTIAGKYGFATSSPADGYGLTIATSTLQYGDWTLIGNATTTGTLAGGNLSIGGDVTLGDAGTDRIVFNGYILSDIIPADNARSLGSSVNRWNYGYFDSINVNELNAGGTNISGTASNEIVINSSNASDDTEDASVVFERGTPVTNAAVRWDASENNINFNFPIWVEGTDTTGQASSTITVKAGINQGNYNLFQIKDVSGNNLVQADPVGHFAVGGYQNGFGVSFATSTYFAGDAVFANGSTFNSITTTDSAYIGGKMQIVSTTTIGNNALVVRGGDGNVGIGTASPIASLTLGSPLIDPNKVVANSIALPYEAKIISGTNTVANYNAEILLFSGTGQTNFINRNSLGNFNFFVGNGGTNQALTIRGDSGNIGIANTNPQFKLDVAGSVNINATSTLFVGGRLAVATSTPYENYGVAFATSTIIISDSYTLPKFVVASSTGASTPALYVASNGNVGVGTNVPTAQLEIKTNATTGYNTVLGIASPAAGVAGTDFIMSSSKGNLRIRQYNGTAGSGPLDGASFFGEGQPLLFITNTTKPIYFGTNNHYLTSNVDFTIGSTGNIGIATTTPFAKLSVVSDDYNLPKFMVASSTGFTTPSLYVASNGNVGIGTASPAYSLDVPGAIYTNTYFRAGSETVYSKGNIQNFFAGGDFQIYTRQAGGTYNTGQLYLKSDSNIGISTTTPYAKLSVVSDDYNLPKFMVASSTGFSTPSLYVASNGNVGVGTGSPTQSLEITNSGQPAIYLYGVTNPFLEIKDTTNSARIRVEAQNSEGQIGTVSSHPLVFETNNNEWMRINTAGNVGIATTTPGGYYSEKLTVQGGAYIQNDTAEQAKFVVGSSTATSLYVGSNGYVGIGTESPSYKLEVHPTGLSNNGMAVYESDDGNVAGALIGNANNGQLNLYSNGGNTIRFAGGWNSFIHNGYGLSIGSESTPPADGLLVAGSVGIANTNPQFKLDVAGDLNLNSTSTAYMRGHAVVGSGTIQDTYGFTIATTTYIVSDSYIQPKFVVASSTGASTPALYVASNGNVGVGTASPTQNLDVSGSAIFGSDGVGVLITAGARLESETSGNDRIDIDAGSWTTQGNSMSFNPGIISDGTLTLGGTSNNDIIYVPYRIGIATTTPTSRLTIQGSGATSATYGLNITDSNGAPTLVVRDDGRVGIGTNSPIELLDVRGTVRGYAASLSSNSGSAILTVNQNGVGDIVSFQDTTNPVFIIRDGGNVGIATTTPFAKLSVVSDDYNLPKFMVASSTGFTTPALYVASNGNVGIGTASPVAKLHVNGGVGSQSTGLAFGDGDTGFYESVDDTLRVTIANQDKFYFSVDFFAGLQNYSGQVQNESSSATNPVFVLRNDEDTGLGRASADILSLIAGGTNIANVATSGFGVGTTTPGGYYGEKLTVVGGAYITSGVTTTALRVASLNVGGDDITDITGTGLAVVDGALSVQGFALSGASGAWENIWTNTLTPTSTTAGIFVNASSTFNSTLRVNGNTTLMGNVGIGTASPGTKLSLGTSGSEDTASSKISVYDNGAIFYGMGLSKKGINYGLGLYAADSFTASPKMFIETTGSVGIATTTPTSRLTIQGSGATSATYGLNITDSNGAPTFVVKDNGYVGLGTNDPGRKLTIYHNSGLLGQLRLGSGSNSYWDIGRENVYTGRFVIYNKEWGSEREMMSILTSGNVGIATTTPYAKLSVVSDDYNLPKFMVASSTGFSTPSLYVASNGNVGIGTASPSANLNVAGSLRVTAAATNVLEVGVTEGYFTVTAGTSDPITFNMGVSNSSFNIKNSSANSLFYVSNSSSNIGIATTTPYAKLSVVSDDYNLPKFMVASSTGFTTPSLYVASNGYVGIGTASPAYTLDVVGEVRATVGGYFGSLGISDSNGMYYTSATRGKYGFGAYTSGYSYPLTMSSGDGISRFGGYITLSTNGTEAMRIASSSAVGIATTTPGGYYSEKLTVQGGAYIQNNTAEQAKFVVGSSTATSLYVASNGNVGIGTNNPTEELEVRGVDTGAIDTAIKVIGGAGGNDSATLQLGSVASREWNIRAKAWDAADLYALNINYNSSDIQGPITFSWNALEKFRFTPTGSLGLSTTTPGGYYGEKLTVVGGAYITGGVTTTALRVSSLNVGGDDITDITGTGLAVVDGALSVQGFALSGANGAWENIWTNTLTPTSTTAGIFVNASSTFNSTLGVNGNFTVASGATTTIGNNALVVRGNDGRVGIGTATPGTKLHIYDASTNVESKVEMVGTGYAISRYTNTNGSLVIGKNNLAGSALFSSDGVSYSGGIGTSNSNPLQFGVNNNAYLTILNGGSIGIATTTPGGYYGEKLTVAGGAYITGGATTTALRVSSLNVNGDDITDITGTGLTITNGALSVQGFALSGANGAWENIWTNTLTPTSTTAGIFVNASSTFNSTLGVNGNFTVASGATTTIGNNALVVRGGDARVGIGTASPGAKLHINIANSATGAGLIVKTGSTFTSEYNDLNSNIHLVGSGVNTINTFGPSISFTGPGYSTVERKQAAIASVQESSDPDVVGLAFFIHPDSGYPTAVEEILRLSSRNGVGQVGIATTTPYAKLSVVSDDYNLPKFMVASSTGFTTPSLYVDSRGYVGVGTNNPTKKLQITGGDMLIMAAEGTNRVLFAGTGDTSGAYMDLYNSAGTPTTRIMGDAGNSSYFNNGGALGIATTTPGGYYGEKLTVAGGAYITGGATTTALRVSSLNVGGDDITDITGTGLTITNGALSVQGFALSGANGAWENIWTNTLTPTSTTAGIFVNASSTFNSTLNVNGNFTVASGATTTIGNNALVVRGNDGRVGIGTNSPTHELTVAGGVNLTNTGSSYNITSNTGLGLNSIWMGGTGGMTLWASNAAGPIIFKPGNAEAGRFIASGALGIATTTPYAKLSVVSDDYTLPKFMVASSTGFATPALYVASNGNVGIGTNNPTASLDVASSGSLPSIVTRGAKDYAYAAGETLTIGTWNGTTYVDKFIIQSDDDFDFNNKVFIKNSSGSFGIATTTPYAKLSVVSDTAELPRFMVASSTGFTTPSLYVASNGSVGVGTGSPEFPLDVNGNIRVGASNGTIIEGNADWEAGDFSLKPFDNVLESQFGWTYYGSGTRKGDIVTTGYGYAPNPNRVFAFRDGAAEVDRMVINVLTGNVGIATSTPGGYYGEKLTVVGGAYITGGATTTALRVSSLNVNGDDISDITGSGLAVIDGALSVQGFALSGSNGSWENIWTNTLTPTSTTAGIFVNASSTFNSTLGVNGNFTVASGATTTIGNNALVVRGGDGNVGIGTGSPGSKLQISLSSAATEISKANNYISLGYGEVALDDYRLIGFGYGGAGYPYQPAYIGYQTKSLSGGTFGDLIFGTRNVGNSIAPSERMRITSAGAIGIATTTPGGYYGEKLTVVGGAYIQNNTAEQAKFVVGSSTATSLYVASNGNVGVGTNAPSTRLDVGSGGTITAYAFYGNSAASYARVERVVSTTSHLDFSGTSATDAIAMRINSSGYLGIANTNPQYTLDVAGSLNLNSTSTAFLNGRLAVATSTPYEGYGMAVATTSIFANDVMMNGNATTTALRVSSLNVNGDDITDITGTGLSIVNGALTVTASGSGTSGAWQQVWTNALAPTSTTAGIFVNASSTFNSTLRVNDTLTIAPVAGNNGLVVQAASGATANLLQLTNSSGSFLSGFTAAGGLLMNIASTTAINVQNGSGNAVFQVDSNGTSAGIDLTAVAAQSANLLNLYNSSSQFLSGFTVAGGLLMNISSSTAIALQNGSGSAVLTVPSNSATATTTLNTGLNVDSGTLVVNANENRVGIGTAKPGVLLDVRDSNNPTSATVLFQVSTSTDVDTAPNIKFKILADGGYYSDGALRSGHADYAEYFKTKDMDLYSGETVCIDVTNNEAVVRCTRGADDNVIGIISTNPSVIGNAPDDEERGNDYALVALLGQIPALVSVENGEIRPGDSLTSASSTPGYLMKANAGDATVGIALQSLSTDKGTIQVLISRRNKSLSVEQVEEQVTKRVADMEIEDEVNIMISEAMKLLGVEDQIKVLGEQLTELNDQNISLLDRLITLENASTDGENNKFEEIVLGNNNLEATSTEISIKVKQLETGELNLSVNTGAEFVGDVVVQNLEVKGKIVVYGRAEFLGDVSLKANLELEGAVIQKFYEKTGETLNFGDAVYISGDNEVSRGYADDAQFRAAIGIVVGFELVENDTDLTQTNIDEIESAIDNNVRIVKVAIGGAVKGFKNLLPGERYYLSDLMYYINNTDVMSATTTDGYAPASLMINPPSGENSVAQVMAIAKSRKELLIMPMIGYTNTISNINSNEYQNESGYNIIDEVDNGGVVAGDNTNNINMVEDNNLNGENASVEENLIEVDNADEIINEADDINENPEETPPAVSSEEVLAPITDSENIIVGQAPVASGEVVVE